jgi:hypothetical protein
LDKFTGDGGHQDADFLPRRVDRAAVSGSELEQAIGRPGTGEAELVGSEDAGDSITELQSHSR